MLVAAELAEGADLEGLAAKLLADPRAEHLQAHFARPGCYAARIERVRVELRADGLRLL